MKVRITVVDTSNVKSENPPSRADIRKLLCCRRSGTPYLWSIETLRTCPELKVNVWDCMATIVPKTRLEVATLLLRNRSGFMGLVFRAFSVRVYIPIPSLLGLLRDKPAFKSKNK